MKKSGFAEERIAYGLREAQARLPRSATCAGRGEQDDALHLVEEARPASTA